MVIRYEGRMFESLDEMYEYLADTYKLFDKGDLGISADCGDGTRVVYTMRLGDKKYMLPQRIGICIIE